MATGTKIRILARQLDGSAAVVWVTDSRGSLIYVSAGAAAWLGIDGESLLHRRCVPYTTPPDDPLDRLASALAPPPGLDACGWMTYRVTPPASQGRPIEARQIGFARVGNVGSPLTFALGGSFSVPTPAGELDDAVAIRRQLDAWRKAQASLATIATAGTSAAARRTRARLQLAAMTRTHIGFYGPPGCGAAQIAARIHHLSTADEPLVAVDGPLMDAELLDDTLGPLIVRLNDSNSATGTALVRELDETPAEAQQRLAELLGNFPGRLRLLAIAHRRPLELSEPFTAAGDEEDSLDPAPDRTGIHPRLVDTLSTLAVTLEPLASRPEDIPLIAAALVDGRHAAGEGIAERIGRAALDAMVLYPWPGNFDELDAAIRHAVRSSQRSAIGVEDLPLAVRSYRPGDPTAVASLSTIPLEQAVRAYEQRLIREAVEMAGGNRAEAARKLGISRAKLIRRLSAEVDTPGS